MSHPSRLAIRYCCLLLLFTTLVTSLPLPALASAAINSNRTGPGVVNRRPATGPEGYQTEPTLTSTVEPTVEEPTATLTLTLDLPTATLTPTTTLTPTVDTSTPTVEASTPTVEEPAQAVTPTADAPTPAPTPTVEEPAATATPTVDTSTPTVDTSTPVVEEPASTPTVTLETLIPDPETWPAETTPEPTAEEPTPVVEEPADQEPLPPEAQRKAPSIELPARAASIEELVQGRVPPVVAAERETGILVARVARSGGAAMFLENRLAVIAGEGTFGADVDLALRLQVDLAETRKRFETEGRKAFANPGAGAIRFQLEALQASDGQELASFDKRLHLVLDLRDLLPGISSRYWYIAYQDPDDPNTWHGVETFVHDETGLISAQVDHFSVWSVGLADAAWGFSWQEPTISLFSGAATYQYPIELPPGRGGLQPNIDISYSSRGVDTIIFPNADQGSLGLGWSMNEIQIVREGVRTRVVGLSGDIEFVHPDDFSLVLDGVGYEMRPIVSTQNPVVQYAVRNAPQIFVQRIYDAGCTGCNPDQIYWVVRTPNGTTYRLGYTPDAAVYQRVHDMCLMYLEGTQHPGTSVCPPGGHGYSGIRWLVDTVTDVHGNQIQYDYETWEEQEGSYQYTSHSLLREIRYNYVTLAGNYNDRLTSGYLTKIVVAYSNHRVTDIKLYHGDLSDHYKRIVPELGTVWYSDCSRAIYPRTEYVKSITEYNDGSLTMPPTTFSYVKLGHSWDECDAYDHLQEIHNGYGGRVKFTYWGDVRREHEPNDPSAPDYGQTFLATQKEVWDGVHADPAVTEYSYAIPCYNQYDGDVGDMSGAYNCPTRYNNGAYGHGSLVGFAKTTETVRDYNGTILSKQTYWFSQVPQTLGQVTLQEAYDANNVLLSRSRTYYTTVPFGSDQTTNSYPVRVVAASYHGIQGLSSDTRYTRDAYNNVTGEEDYGQEERIRMQNPSFEDANVGWTYFGDPTPAGILNGQGVALTGWKVLKLQGSADGGAYQDVAGLTPNQTYIIRAWVRGSAAAMTSRVYFWLHDTTGSNAVTTAQTVPSTSWTQISASYTANSTGKVRIHLRYSPGTGTIYVDEVEVARLLAGNKQRSILSTYHNIASDDPYLTWLIGLKFREDLYDSFIVETRVLQTQTFWSYDNQPWSYSSGVTKGQVTEMSTGLQSGGPLISTQYEYDPTWGYLTSQTDPNGYTSTTEYETTYHLFPIEACNALNQCSQTFFYGVNGSAAENNGLFGQVERVQDPNSASTYARYDTFGRPVKIIRPGDSDAQPTVGYTYRDPLSEWLLVPNGNMETSDAYWYEWDAPANQTFSYDATTRRSGTQSLKIVTTGGGDHWVGQQGVTGWKAGRTYWVRAWIKGPSGVGFCLNVSGKSGHEAALSCPTLNGSWQSVSGYVTLPTDATQFKILLRAQGAGTFYVDEVQVGSLFEVSTYAKEDAANNTLWSRQVYDGLGRALQTQSEIDTDQASLSQQEYDARGLALNASLAQSTTADDAGRFYATPKWDTLWNKTRYDALGRAVRMVAPDGATNVTVYGGPVTAQVDANGHYQASTNDSLGRLVKVDETLVTWEDEFEDGSTSGWSVSSGVTESGGVIRITGNSAWGTRYISRSNAAGNDKGILFDFKFDAGSPIAILMLRSGTWGQSDYRRWALYANGTTLYEDHYQGTSHLQVNVMTLSTGVWYRVLMKAGSDGEMVVQVWERLNPAVLVAHYEMRGTGWTGRTWQFFVDQYAGAVEIDHYREFNYQSTTYAYNPMDNLTEVWDAASNHTTMQYNALGRKTGMHDPDMGDWTYGYDDVGNLTSQTDARSCTTSLGYDELNRLQTKTYGGTCSGTAAVSYTYDQGVNGIGRRTRMDDGSGYTTWTYDARGRATAESKTISGGGTFVTQYTYDPLDRVTTMTYPGSVGTVTTEYNRQGLPKAMYSGTQYYAAGGASGPFVAYNAAGQITRLPVGSGVKTTYVYDPLTMRLAHSQVMSTTGLLLDLLYSYDPASNVTRLNDRRGFTFYDAFNSKTADWTWSSYQAVYNDNGNNVIRSTGTGTDLNSNFYRSSYNLSDGKGLRVRFKLDQADTLAHFAIENNDATYRRFGIRADGGKIYVQYSESGYNWQYPLDLIDSLQLNTWYVLYIRVDDSENGFSIEVYQENNPALQGSYRVRLAAGKQWRFHHWIYRGNAYIDAYGEFNEGNRFTYDSLDRLTHAWTAGSDVAPYDQTYAYNAIGNITSKTGVGSYSYGSSTHVHAVTSLSDGSSYGYDANGNMTTRAEGGVTYQQTFDGENRLVSVTWSGQTTTFTYDGDGQRVKEVDPSGTTYYVGNYYEKKGSTVTTYYYLGGQRVAMRVGSTVYYLHGDHLGSTSLSTSASQAVVAQRRYYPYGEFRWSSGTLPTDYTFTGQRSDTYTQLIEMGVRWYNPRIGRWISPDTIIPGFEDPQNLNRFAYVRNNPVRHRDVTGHCIDMGDGLCVRETQDGTYRIVRGGSYFVNPTEVALENALLSGDLAYLDRMPEVLEPWQAGLLTQTVFGDRRGFSIDLDVLMGCVAVAKMAATELEEWGAVNGRLVYERTFKHSQGGWGTPINLSDEEAEEVLNQGVQSGKKIYGYYNGRIYEFHYDNQGRWHGYEIPGNRVPSDVRKMWKNDSIITTPEYNRMIQGRR